MNLSSWCTTTENNGIQIMYQPGIVGFKFRDVNFSINYIEIYWIYSYYVAFHLKI